MAERSQSRTLMAQEEGASSDFGYPEAAPAKMWLRRLGAAVGGGFLLSAVVVILANRLTHFAPATPLGSLVYANPNAMAAYDLTSSNQSNQSNATAFDQDCSNSACLCGSIVCGVGSQCCTNPNGNGMCVRGGSYCCHGSLGVLACSSAENCCRNRGGAAFCCAGSLRCGESICYTDQCFPGFATVQSSSRGLVAVEDLQIGDEILVGWDEFGAPAYESVLGFLHTMKNTGTAHEFLTVTHSHGKFSATANHMVFVDTAVGREVRLMGELRAGDKLVLADRKSDVWNIRAERGNVGLYAPLTASGTIVIDSVLASIYGAASTDLKFSHAAAHAVFFPVRFLYASGLGQMFGSSTKAAENEIHPYAAFLLKQLQ